jgi:hypothetical protein
MTSHLDVPATLLGLLGATNPPGEYSLGQSLLEGPARSYALVSDWSRVGYVDASGKVSFAASPSGWFKQSVSDRSDAPLADPGGWMRAHTASFGRLLADLARFTQGAEVPAASPPAPDPIRAGTRRRSAGAAASPLRAAALARQRPRPTGAGRGSATSRRS